MEQQPYFKETQRFWDVWWIKLLFVCIIVAACYGSYTDYGLQGFTSHNFLISISGVALVAALFYAMKLEVSLDAHGINYKFFPFHIRRYEVNWPEVDKVYVRDYRPLIEYGGWGIRMGLFGAGTAYNVSGSTGLQVELNKRRILFGTKRSEELMAALKALTKAGVLKSEQTLMAN